MEITYTYDGKRFAKNINLVPVYIFGSSLAMIISWSIHKSLFWAIVHGVFSWGYETTCSSGYKENEKLDT